MKLREIMPGLVLAFLHPACIKVSVFLDSNQIIMCIVIKLFAVIILKHLYSYY